MKWTCNTTWNPQSGPDLSGEHCWSTQIQVDWVFVGYISKHSTAFSVDEVGVNPAASKSCHPRLKAKYQPLPVKTGPFTEGSFQSPASSPGEGETSGHPA